MASKRVFIIFLVFSFVVLFVVDQTSQAGTCSSNVIKSVTKNTGCSIGKSGTNCWLKKGGYCTDYIQKKTGHRQAGDANKWKNSGIKTKNVKKGDVAIFKSITHVAYVESVNKDKKGNPVSVKISEYNYGSCWVDQYNLVTDKYGIVTTRTVDFSKVDGGFWRP